MKIESIRTMALRKENLRSYEYGDDYQKKARPSDFTGEERSSQ